MLKTYMKGTLPKQYTRVHDENWYDKRDIDLFLETRIETVDESEKILLQTLERTLATISCWLQQAGIHVNYRKMKDSITSTTCGLWMMLRKSGKLLKTQLVLL